MTDGTEYLQMNAMRARYLRDKVMTATPAQRVVMLHDRLVLDLTLAKAESDVVEAGRHIGHAAQIVAELYGSLDVSAGGPAENLASIYTFLLGELMGARTSHEADRLDVVESIVATLREAWATVAASVVPPNEATGSSLAASAWVG
jgi:flagellar secretion chaperone FliS